MISLHKNGQERRIPLAELQKWTGARYAPYLEFSDLKILRKLTRKHANLEKTREQLWLGTYFQFELLHETLPDVSLRWINDRMGWGLFAERDFKPMEFIAEYSGLVRSRRSSDRHNAYCFEYILTPDAPTPYLIDAQDQGGLSRYINHSDTPNLTSALATIDQVSHVVLYTNQPVMKNTQLCYDYGLDYWKYRKKP